MKKVLETGGILIAVILILYFFGTQPVKEKQEAQVNASITPSRQWDKVPAMAIDKNKAYTAIIETSKGTLKANLLADEAPLTVNNFVFLSREHFYDSVKFHRIIQDFMVQTGDPTGTGMGGPGYKFADEKVTRSYSRGTLAMANSGPNTNGSQFFIMTQDNETLPKSYTIFGTIAQGDVESFKTLDAIAATPVNDNGMGEQSKPAEDVTIKTITIEEK